MGEKDVLVAPPNNFVGGPVAPHLALNSPKLSSSTIPLSLDAHYPRISNEYLHIRYISRN